MGKSKNIGVFIDSSNTWQAQKAKGKFLEWSKLKAFLLKKHSAKSITCYYYTAYPAEGTRDYSLEGKHRFYTYLKRGLGFVVRKKPLKQIRQSEEGHGESVVEKGDMDVELTIDAVHNKDKYSEIIIFSGDSDFLSLVSYLRRDGKKVYIYSSKNNASTELRTGGDGYFDILNISEDIWGRDMRHRPSK